EDADRRAVAGRVQVLLCRRVARLELKENRVGRSGRKRPQRAVLGIGLAVAVDHAHAIHVDGLRIVRAAGEVERQRLVTGRRWYIGTETDGCCELQPAESPPHATTPAVTHRISRTIPRAHGRASLFARIRIPLL